MNTAPRRSAWPTLAFALLLAPGVVFRQPVPAAANDYTREVE